MQSSATLLYLALIIKTIFGNLSSFRIDWTVLAEDLNVLGHLVPLQDWDNLTSEFQDLLLPLNGTVELSQQVKAPANVHRLTLDDIKTCIVEIFSNFHPDILSSP